MKGVLLALGVLCAVAGAVFIGIGGWLFLNGTVRSIFALELWLWIGLHIAAALASLVFFRLAAPAVAE